MTGDWMLEECEDEDEEGGEWCYQEDGQEEEPEEDEIVDVGLVNRISTQTFSKLHLTGPPGYPGYPASSLQLWLACAGPWRHQVGGSGICIGGLLSKGTLPLSSYRKPSYDSTIKCSCNKAETIGDQTHLCSGKATSKAILGFKWFKSYLRSNSSLGLCLFMS